MSTPYDAPGYFEVDDEPIGIVQAFAILLTGATTVATGLAVYFLIFFLGQYGG